MRQSGRSFKNTVNECLRRGLNFKRQARPEQPFVVRARPLGLRPSLSYDKIGDLLDAAEGPNRK